MNWPVVCVLCVFSLTVCCYVAGPRLSASQCVDGMASGLYEEFFTAIVSLMNRYSALPLCHL